MHKFSKKQKECWSQIKTLIVKETDKYAYLKALEDLIDKYKDDPCCLADIRLAKNGEFYLYSSQSPINKI